MGSDAYYGGPGAGVQSGPGVDTTAAHRAPASQETGGLNLAGAVAAALGFTTPGPTQGYGRTLPLIQSGQANITILSGQALGTLNVTFPYTFVTSPVVVVTTAGDVGVLMTVSASAASAGGFILNARQAANVGSNSTYAVWWVAIAQPN
jgi:hypothetical protein